MNTKTATTAAPGSPAAARVLGAPPATLIAALEEVALEQVLERAAVRSLYQPIVEIDSGMTVAYEALARGPRGSLLEQPGDLFRVALRHGRSAELDWTCRAAALRGAREAGVEPPLTLFVNVEPSACPAQLRADVRPGGDLAVVVELTERALTARPAELLRVVGELRAAGWGIALDDVGADVRSLALMPLLRPEVIKLDLRLVQRQASDEIAEIVNAVNAESERTGALVLAEGVETEAHLATARAMGATLAQGWLFGRPAPLPVPLPPRSAPLPLAPPPPARDGATPFEVVAAGGRPVRAADKRLLLSMTRTIERQAGGVGEGAVVVSAFQTAERFRDQTRRRYAELAQRSALVAVLGIGMADEPAPGVRGAVLAPDDPLAGEWSVVVIGPHFAAALVAQDMGDAGPEPERRFRFALTYDRDLVLAAAAPLIERVLPL